MQKYSSENRSNTSKPNKSPYDLNTYSKSIRSNEVKAPIYGKSTTSSSSTNKRVFVLSDTLK